MTDFLEIYEKERVALYNFILGRVRHRQIAEDVLSETMLRAIRYVRGGAQVTHASGLLYRIARNLIIEHYREQGKTVQVDDIISIPDERQDVEEEVEKRVRMEEMLRNIRCLGKNDQLIIKLRYIEQKDIGEIAQILEKTEGAVRVQIHRATQTLRDRTFYGDRRRNHQAT